MSDTRGLLERIATFRSRLEEIPQLAGFPVVANDPSSVRMFLTAVTPPPRMVTEIVEPKPETIPLSARTIRLLHDAKQLVDRQKKLANEPFLTAAGDESLANYHRGIVGLTDTALRVVSVFPASIEAQQRACEGLENLLGVVRHRLNVLDHALGIRSRETGRIQRLTEILSSLHAGRTVSVPAISDLAEEVLDESRRGLGMRMLPVDPHGPLGVAGAVATHALNVGQVLARLTQYDYEWASKPALLIFAALVMDVGMLDVPPGDFGIEHPANSVARRIIEGHPRRSSEIVQLMLPETGPLAEVVVAHHERIDGTGYPNGLRGESISSPARFLAMADAYADRVAEKPNRPACDSRTALTEVLLASENGQLDRDFAEYALNLTFHPIGTVVELMDGRTAVVVSAHNSRTNLRATTRPVVAILVAADGQTMPRPEFLDLASADIGGIARELTAVERRERLSETYPDMCW